MSKQNTFKKIAVFRALQLGDMLCSIPAIKALKEKFPEAEIDLIGLPWAKDFVNRFPHYFNGFIPFPGFPGLPEQGYDPFLVADFILEMNKKKYDLIIQMQGNGSVINPLIALLGAKEIVGYFESDKYMPSSGFIPYPEHCHEIERHLTLIKSLGIDCCDTSLEFPVLESELNQFQNLKKEFNLQERKYVCIHPGARDIKRRWKSEYFSKIAEEIAGYGFKLVFTGTESERKIIENVILKLRSEYVNLCGKTNIGTISLLIKEAFMLFSNDTGVSHIATAVKTPSVVLFLTSDPMRWAPMNKQLHRIIMPKETNNYNIVSLMTKQLINELKKSETINKS
ncbi:MAG: glycosyltransferase family 9 protein [Cytophagaceae bacterium]